MTAPWICSEHPAARVIESQALVRVARLPEHLQGKCIHESQVPKVLVSVYKCAQCGRSVRK